MQISRSVMAIGGVVLAAALIGFTNPKAVRAVTAALVQVTNTAANPVVTQSIGQQAAQAVVLSCNSGNAFGSGLCFSVPNGVQSQTPYVVPANESLVITAVDIDAYFPDHDSVSGLPACNAGRQDAISTNASAILIWQMVNTTSPAHFTYPSGVVFGPSATLTPSSHHYNTSLDSQCGADSMQLYGYLTAS